MIKLSKRNNVSDDIAESSISHGENRVKNPSSKANYIKTFGRGQRAREQWQLEVTRDTSFNAFNFPLMAARGKNGDVPRQMPVK